MTWMSVEQVRATGVADLAACVLGMSDGQLLGLDAESAEAVVAAAQRLINAVTAVQVVAIEAWGRREGEQLVLDKAQWQIGAGGQVGGCGGRG